MKKILLLSDNHGYLDDKILAHAAAADEIWHAGDWGDYENLILLEKMKKVRGVYGNIDEETLRSALPEIAVFECEGLKVCIKHIGGYPDRYAKGVKNLLLDKKPDLFISGHSHICKVMRDTKLNLLHFNPGACGKHGFHHIRTLMRFAVTEGVIQNLEIIELGKRATIE